MAAKPKKTINSKVTFFIIIGEWSVTIRNCNLRLVLVITVAVVESKDIISD